MADECDVANERAELALQVALRARRPEGPAPAGLCLWCGHGVGLNHRWCDAECRDDWERANAAPR